MSTVNGESVAETYNTAYYFNRLFHFYIIVTQYSVIHSANVFDEIIYSTPRSGQEERAVRSA